MRIQFIKTSPLLNKSVIMIAQSSLGQCQVTPKARQESSDGQHKKAQHSEIYLAYPSNVLPFLVSRFPIQSENINFLRCNLAIMFISVSYCCVINHPKTQSFQIITIYLAHDSEEWQFGLRSAGWFLRFLRGPLPCLWVAFLILAGLSHMSQGLSRMAWSCLLGSRQESKRLN